MIGRLQLAVNLFWGYYDPRGFCYTPTPRHIPGPGRGVRQARGRSSQCDRLAGATGRARGTLMLR